MTIFGVIKKMKHFIAILAFIMTTMATQAQTTDKQAIEQLYELMYSAMIEKDSATLGSVIADDFVLVHMTGMRQTKQQYINAIADGTLNYYSCQTEQLAVDIDGDRATLTGRSRVLAAVYGGGKHTWRLQLTFRLRKQDGRWQFTYSTASTY